MPLNISELYSDAANSGFNFYMPSLGDMPMPLVMESGQPDPATYPIEDFARLYKEVLEEDREELQYGTPVDGDLSYGSVQLRDQLIARTKRVDGRDIERNQIMLTGGGVQGISLAAQAFLNRGDVAAIEQPTWEYILRDVNVIGAEPVAIPIDDEGLQLDVLEAEIKRAADGGKKLKLLYTIPTFNVPTGISLSLDRRHRLLDLAAEHGFMIVEDNVYGDLRYDGEPVPTLFALDQAGSVVKIDSFSKTLMPALRLAWVTGDATAIAALDRVRRDLGVGQLVARVVGRFLAEDKFEAHIGRACGLYRSKRDAALEAIDKYCAPWVTSSRPEGGYFLWLSISDEVDGAQVQAKALAEGVMCRPGERFFGQTELPGQFLRLAFTTTPVEDLVRAIEVLGKACSDSLK